MERGDRAFKIAKAHRISVVEYQKKIVSLQPHKKSLDFLVQWGSVGDALFMEFRCGTE